MQFSEQVLIQLTNYAKHLVFRCKLEDTASALSLGRETVSEEATASVMSAMMWGHRQGTHTGFGEETKEFD